jgi:sec-independent protein translocase protein TatA
VNLGGWEIVIILGILLLLFGAKRLPDMARSIGQSARVFKGEMKGMKEDGKGETPAAPAAPPAQIPPATPATPAAPAAPVSAAVPAPEVPAATRSHNGTGQ